MSDTEPGATDDHQAALGEARELLAGGLIGEAIRETRNVAVAIDRFASELAADRIERREELHSLRSRNAVQGVALALSVLVLAAVLFVGLGRLGTIATDNRSTGRDVAECNTPSPGDDDAIDAADAVHECYEAAQERAAFNRAAISDNFLDAAFCVARLGFGDEHAVRECYDARLADRGITTTSTTRPGGRP